MALNKNNPKSMERYREYQRNYQREYGKNHYKYNKEHKKNITCINKFRLYLGIFYWKIK